MKRIKPYLIEFTIVTSGVLIALFLSNLKESNQVREYHFAAIETINMEVQDNYSALERIVKKQTNLLDTLFKYVDSPLTIMEIFQKSNGLQMATLSNAGLDFYKKDQISSIDFKMMSTLIQMNSSSDLILYKAEKLIDYTYSNVFDNTKECKMVVILQLKNVLDTENQLMELYEDFIYENIEVEFYTK